MKKKGSKKEKKSSRKTGKFKIKLNSNPKKLREDFEIFGKGVERLEELRTELNRLNTKGFETEAGAIKSKLKNVSYIPEIERELRILKQKIKGGVSESKKSVDDSEVRRKIKELENEIRRKRKISFKKQLSKDEIKMVRAIPRLEERLADFKRFVDEQKSEERRKRELLKKIDPNVNFIVNDKFNLSLNEIKAELAKRLENKEISVQKQLHEDLDARKKNFELQYKELENRFEQKYKEKVNLSLNKEIKRRFDDVLRQRLNNEKIKLARENVERLRIKKKELDERERKKLRGLDEKKAKIKKRLNLEFFKKLKSHEKKLNDEAGKIKKRLSLESERKLKEEEKKLGEVLSAKKVQILDRQEKQLERGFAFKFARIMGIKRKTIEKERWIEESAKRLKEENEERRKELDEKMKKELEKRKNLLNKEKERILAELEREHEKLKSQIKKEKEEEMKLKEAESQTKVSKAGFEKLRDKLVEELGNKKANLEKEYNLKLDSEKDRLRKHFDEEILAKKFALNNVMHEKLTGEVMKIHQEHKAREQRSMDKVEEMKKNLENERGLLSTLKNRFNLKLMKLKTDEKGFKDELRQKLEKEKQEAVKKAVKEQSEIMKRKLKQEFDEKLKLEIQSKQAEFEKRKADLALDVQKRAKQLFG